MNDHFNVSLLSFQGASPTGMRMTDVELSTEEESECGTTRRSIAKPVVYEMICTQ